MAIPIAFAAAASGPKDLEREVRIACRNASYASRLMERILPDITHVLAVPDDKADEFAADQARPAQLWEPRVFPSDMPIGDVLDVRAATADLPPKERRDGRDDPGTSDSIATG